MKPPKLCPSCRAKRVKTEGRKIMFKCGAVLLRDPEPKKKK